MSNCCANSASVLSPRTAAKATFALKAGVWFRRGRLVIISPGLQPSWLLSGRNSTYPAVQISRASSVADRQRLAERDKCFAHTVELAFDTVKVQAYRQISPTEMGSNMY